MLKKILILFLSTHLCAAKNIDDFWESHKRSLRESKERSAQTIRLGLAFWVAHTILPNFLESSIGKRIATIVGAALGAYSLSQICNSNVSTNETMHTDEVQKDESDDAHETDV